MLRRPPKSPRTNTLFPTRRSSDLGMAQTVQLLGTIVNRPRLLVLDEPFAGLDAINQARPEELIRARSEEHTSELQSLMRISYAVFCLKKKHNTLRNKKKTHNNE